MIASRSSGKNLAYRFSSKNMHPGNEHQAVATRRHFFHQTGVGIGFAALGWLLHSDRAAASAHSVQSGILSLTHHRPTAKRVIYLFQSGAPSQLETFDYKPALKSRHGEELPAT